MKGFLVTCSNQFRAILREYLFDAASGRTWDEVANADWIRWVRNEGHEVIDIRLDFGRRLDFLRNPSIPGARPPSGVYGNERLELFDYGNYQSVFDRNGRFWGGVSGIDAPSIISPLR